MNHHLKCPNKKKDHKKSKLLISKEAVELRNQCKFYHTHIYSVSPLFKRCRKKSKSHYNAHPKINPMNTKSYYYYKKWVVYSYNSTPLRFFYMRFYDFRQPTPRKRLYRLPSYYLNEMKNFPEKRLFSPKYKTKLKKNYNGPSKISLVLYRILAYF